ncbi:amiloride-sensitive sodium channel subunit alpha-like isoform X2 [Centruroides vittatus]|uniref:amiloride-sensitive sodium channel subunit alpha-like isoform X2 n=1 Tax=Centruroides vittatus TaxID=120091 RepID=UPI003510B4CF
MEDKMDDVNMRRNKKPTWKEKWTYFLNLLENVLLTGVPQIVTERNTRRKTFRTCVFFLCLTGFFYHLISFIMLYLTYPTTLEVLVKYQNDSTLPRPLVTVCDINGIRRSSYCEAFPDNCEKVEDPDDVEALCKHFEYFCKNESIVGDDLMFPTYETFLFSDFDRNVVEKHGVRKEDILNIYSNKSSHIIFGNEFGKLRNCYSVDLHKFDTTNSLEDFRHRFYEMHMIQGTTIGNLIITFNPEESFLPNVPIGAKISIHSHDQLINPFVDGFLVKPGMRYVVQLKAIEENLLASPYSTNCTIYEVPEGTENTENNHERCLIECKKEKWIKECGCVSGEYAYHFDGKFCLNQSEAICITNAAVYDCYDKCKVSCKSMFFEYEIDEVPLENKELLLLMLQKLNISEFNKYKPEKIWFSSINFFFKRPELLIYKYKPQFQLIELFSYIGGYIGIWLGISLIAVCDFIETLFTYFYHISKGKIPIKNK